MIINNRTINSDDFEEEDNKRCCQVVEYLRRVAVVIGTEENEVVGLPAMMATAATGANLCRLRGLVETMYLYSPPPPPKDGVVQSESPGRDANVLCNLQTPSFSLICMVGEAIIPSWRSPSSSEADLKSAISG